jgi:HAAS domain-containing protein
VSDTPVTDPADRYLEEVRHHLAGLGDDERDELLEDLAAHLHEVAADDPRPLDETLGPPERFAAELLASAGLEGPAAGGQPARLARWQARSRRVRDHQWTRAVAAYLPELRPAWWVLRAYLIVLGLAALLADGVDDLSAFPVPSLGSPIVGLVAVAAAIVPSVRLGRSTAAAGKPRTGVRLVNGVAVLLALVALGHVHDRLDDGSSDFVDPAYADPGLVLEPSSGLTRSDGMPITNIYAYDQQGELLSDVLLYDQDGNPLDLGDVFADPVTGNELVTDYPIDANGAQIRNAYPLDQRGAQWDDQGVRRERAVRPPAVVVPPPSTTTPTSTTTTTRP